MRKDFLAILGLSLIIVSILFFDNRYLPPFPNYFTLVPTLGTAMIIIFANHRTFVGRLLSTYPMRWIGLISYSAYLWHQPSLVFVRLRSYETGSAANVNIAVAAVFVLALLSYFLIERPFRNRTLFSQKQIFSTAGICTTLMLIAAWFLIYIADNRSTTVRIANDENQFMALKTIKEANRSAMLKSIDPEYVHDVNPYDLSTYTVQAFDNLTKMYPTFSNDPSAKNKRILLVGDSYAQDFLNMAIATHSLSNYEIRGYYVRVQCQIYMGPENRLQWIPSYHRQMCVNEHDIKFGLHLIRQADIIILAACWFEWSAERLPKTVELLNLTQSQRLLVIGAKNFGTVNYRWYANKTLEYRLQLWNPPEERYVKVNAILKQAFKPSVYVDVISMTCLGHNGTCLAFTRDGKLITYDGQHVTKYGSRYVGNIIFKQFPLNQL